MKALSLALAAFAAVPCSALRAQDSRCDPTTGACCDSATAWESAADANCCQSLDATPTQLASTGALPADQDRPFLGVMLGGSDEGALITSVIEGTAAAAAKLRAGDVVVGIDGREVESIEALVSALQGHRVGDQVPMRILRNGNLIKLSVTLGSTPESMQEEEGEDEDEESGEEVEIEHVVESALEAFELEDERGWLGVQVAEEDNGEVSINSVYDNSPAARSGLMAGDIITGVGDTEVRTFDALAETLGSMKPGQKTTVAFRRKGVQHKARVELGERMEEATVAGMAGATGGVEAPRVAAPSPAANRATFELARQLEELRAHSAALEMENKTLRAALEESRATVQKIRKLLESGGGDPETVSLVREWSELPFQGIARQGTWLTTVDPAFVDVAACAELACEEEEECDEEACCEEASSFAFALLGDDENSGTFQFEAAEGLPGFSFSTGDEPQVLRLRKAGKDGQGEGNIVILIDRDGQVEERVIAMPHDLLGSGQIRVRVETGDDDECEACDDDGEHEEGDDDDDGDEEDEMHTYSIRVGEGSEFSRTGNLWFGRQERDDDDDDEGDDDDDSHEHANPFRVKLGHGEGQARFEVVLSTDQDDGDDEEESDEPSIRRRVFEWAEEGGKLPQRVRAVRREGARDARNEQRELRVQLRGLDRSEVRKAPRAARYLFVPENQVRLPKGAKLRTETRTSSSSDTGCQCQCQCSGTKKAPAQIN